VFLARSDRDSQRKNLPDKKPEWIIMPLTNQLFRIAIALQEHLEEVVMQGKVLNSKAMTCIWTTPD
jgi:hypothetical protein